jgi:MFS family permease
VSRLTILRAPHGTQFRRLFLGQSVSLLGSMLSVVATPFAVLAIGGSATDIGLVGAAGLVPLLLLLAVGGVWADRLPRQKVMLAADLARAALQVTTAVLLIGGEARVWHLVVLRGLMGICDAFFRPAGTGLVPQTAPDGHLQQANGLLALADSSSVTLGAAFGGLLVAGLGPGWAMGLDGATYLISAAFLWRLRPRPASAPETAVEGFVAELVHGWREFVSHRWLWVMVSGASAFLFLTQGPLNVLGPLVARTDYDGARTWGFALAALGGGQILGGLLSLRWRPGRPLLVVAAGMSLTAVPMALLAIRAPAGMVVSSCALMGFEWGLYNPFWMTAMQREVAPDRLSRVSAWDMMGSLAFYPAGLVVAGPLASLVGLNAMLWIGAGCAVAVAIAQVMVKEVRSFSLTRGDTVVRAVRED